MVKNKGDTKYSLSLRLAASKLYGHQNHLGNYPNKTTECEFQNFHFCKSQVEAGNLITNKSSGNPAADPEYLKLHDPES